MQFLVDLWLPILLSGAAAFVISAVAWTALPHHGKERSKLPNEDAVMSAVRAGNPAPGLYNFPHVTEHAELATPEFRQKMDAGVMAYLTVFPAGMPPMGPKMLNSFLGYVVVSVFVAYVASITLAPDATYLHVFRVTGTVTFMAYALGSMPESIWFARPWKSFFLGCADSLAMALVTAGVFGWLWN